MNQKGYELLKGFLEKFDSNNIEMVISCKDRNVKKDYYNEIEKLCNDNQILFFDKKHEPQISSSSFSFAVGWRWIIKSSGKLIVFHDSILPRYRGFAPLVSCLINKESQIGVTALFASTEYDKGEIVGQKFIDIDYPIKIQNAIEQISGVYKELFLEISTKILRGQRLTSFSQDESKASYSLWRNEEDYRINWQANASFIKRFIDAVGFPYKGSFSFIDNKKVRILDAELVEDVKIENRDPGKVIFLQDNYYPIVVCGEGLLKITVMVDETSGENLLPLKIFRVRFD
jgi:methionyl-tRNA formyltransferase